MSERYTRTLDKLRKNGRLRELRPLQGRSGCRIEYENKELLNLTSNDYLGLAGDLLLHKEFYRHADSTEDSFLDGFGLGSASSRLLTGDSQASHDLETLIKNSYDSDECLLFNSGYHANIGILPAILGKNDLLLSDKLNHASLMDALRLCRSKSKRFHHCDYDHLETLLKKYRDQFDTVVIASESVFSMDGDVADIEHLIRIKEKYNCMFYLDEAHGVGLYGKTGLGKAQEFDCHQEIDILVGTFGKAFGSIGAYAVCSRQIKQYLINHSRSLIFTTALPPVVIHWNRFIFEKMISFAKKRSHLLEMSRRLRNEIRSQGLVTDGNTNIVPVMIGDDQYAVKLAQQMITMGYLIFPVRPPAVPEKTARFRISLTADMQWSDISDLASDIVKAKKEIVL